MGLGVRGESTYSRDVKVVLPVIATAIALAPSSPILLSPRLKRGGRVRRWLNNVLIHLHNYTAGRYRVVGYCIVVGGKKWVWGLGWNRGVNQLT